LARRKPAIGDDGEARLGLFAGVQWIRLAIKDDRFRVAEAEEPAGQSPNLVVEGVHYASASQVRHVFSQDFGRNLYLVPLQARREQLLEIDWVQDATVSKIWPDTLRVAVREREPVAFVRLPPQHAGEGSRLALIDLYGHILRPRVAAKFTLPVIVGVLETETIESRRARVTRALEMLQEMGPLADAISEVDVSDPNNLVVAEHVGNDVVNLIVGDENYAERLRNFLANYSEIKEKRPDATTLDLRVDGVITAVGDNRFER
jgi:cell division protein FtsQ